MEPDVEPHREPDAQPDMTRRGADDGAAAGPARSSGLPDGRPALETLLDTALRGRADDPVARTRAVAAFRTARDSGAHTARTRRRDDWRPKGRRGPNRSLRAAFAVLLAGLTLGGVAFAAVGPITHENAGRRDASAAPPSTGVPDRFSASPPPASPAAPGATSAPGGPSGRPPQANDTEAHCRAYASVRGRGNALDARAWQRLVTAAGGEDEVEAFCAGQLAAQDGTKGAKGANGATGAGSPGKADGTSVPGSPAATRPGKSGSGR